MNGKYKNYLEQLFANNKLMHTGLYHVKHEKYFGVTRRKWPQRNDNNVTFDIHLIKKSDIFNINFARVLCGKVKQLSLIRYSTKQRSGHSFFYDNTVMLSFNRVFGSNILCSTLHWLCFHQLMSCWHSW